LSKEFLFTFSEEHPEVLERYKESLVWKAKPPKDEQIEEIQQEPRKIDYQKIAEALGSIPAGSEAANAYHTLIMGVLDCIFYPALRKPVKEQEIHEGRKRIDIVFNNGADSGLLFDLTAKHGLDCPYIFFECKNYSSDPRNPEFDQLTGRFNNKRGTFGVLVCRTVQDKETMFKRCKDIAQDNRGYVIVLDDIDVEALLRLRAKNEHRGLDDYIDDKFRRLVM